MPCPCVQSDDIRAVFVLYLCSITSLLCPCLGGQFIGCVDFDHDAMSVLVGGTICVCVQCRQCRQCRNDMWVVLIVDSITETRTPEASLSKMSKEQET